MITMEQVSAMNVDDYIRQEKREGRREIHWDKSGANILKMFVKRNGFSFIDGVKYMGVTHYGL